MNKDMGIMRLVESVWIVGYGVCFVLGVCRILMQETKRGSRNV